VLEPTLSHAHAHAHTLSHTHELAHTHHSHRPPERERLNRIRLVKQRSFIKIAGEQTVAMFVRYRNRGLHLLHLVGDSSEDSDVEETAKR